MFSCCRRRKLVIAWCSKVLQLWNTIKHVLGKDRRLLRIRAPLAATLRLVSDQWSQTTATVEGLTQSTHDIRWSVDRLFSNKCHDSRARIEPTISDVKGATLALQLYWSCMRSYLLVKIFLTLSSPYRQSVSVIRDSANDADIHGSHHTMQVKYIYSEKLTSTRGVVVTKLAFQAGRPGFNPCSDLYSRS